MKKLLLLILSGSFAIAGNAQERVMFAPSSPDQMSAAQLSGFLETHKHYMKNQKAPGTAAKTTAAPRWYSYVDYFDQNETALSSSTAGVSMYMWRRNNAYMNYTGGYDTSQTVSIGLVTDPAYSATLTGFNNPTYYLGEMKVTAADNYNVDSLHFFGFYGVNPAKIGPGVGYVDTLRVTFVYGNGAMSSDIREFSNTISAGSPLTNYGPVGGTLKNQRMVFDTIKATASGATRVVTDILLDNTIATPTWTLDTNSLGQYVGKVGIGGATGVAVPAGSMIGASLTFISGDPNFTPYDTVFRGSAWAAQPYKYHMFRPIVIFRGSSTAASYPAYNVDDRNTGQFKTYPDTALGWGAQYTPQWFWFGTGGGAAQSQYPAIDFHVICGSCGVVSSVGVVNVTEMGQINAYPNPASTELNITFAVSNPTSVTVTLSNVLGQVVAEKTLNNAGRGKVVFNTATLSPGIYTYSVYADGHRSTGRVAIH